ncbi:MAG: biopolymer transport protein TolQ [Alphaproteobacteria bacterium]|jgi:biopolymer transport protein TolQ
MEPSAIEAVSLGGQAALEMSVWSLFLRADLVVKLVMIILIMASFWSWAIIFEKFRRIRRIEADAAEFEDTFWAGGSLEQLYERIGGRPSDPMENLFASAMREWRRSTEKGLLTSEAARDSLQARIERVMGTTMARETDRLERHMVFLASVGSTSPFIGLFGTVWGIMNSFQAIAVSKNTSLAVVAPGIAEALFATALGLVAAIPAVLAYNKFSTDLGRYAGRMDGFINDFTAILSRQLQEKS